MSLPTKDPGPCALCGCPAVGARCREHREASEEYAARKPKRVTARLVPDE